MWSIDHCLCIARRILLDPCRVHITCVSLPCINRSYIDRVPLAPSGRIAYRICYYKVIQRITKPIDLTGTNFWPLRILAHWPWSRDPKGWWDIATARPAVAQASFYHATQRTTSSVIRIEYRTQRNQVTQKIHPYTAWLTYCTLTSLAQSVRIKLTPHMRRFNSHSNPKRVLRLADQLV